MYWFLAMVTFLVFIIKGMAGFANSLFFGAVLAQRIDNIMISPMDLLLSLPSNAIFTWKERKLLKRNVWLPLSVLVLLGSIPGVFFLKIGDARNIKIMFGFLVVFVALEMFFRERSTKVHTSSKSLLVIIGLISGICCGLYGIGAVLAAYVSRTTTNMKEFKSNICFVFTVENIFRVFLYTATGIITWDIFLTTLSVVPFMLAGLFVGMKLADKVEEKTVKNTIILLLILSGVYLIITNLI